LFVLKQEADQTAPTQQQTTYASQIANGERVAEKPSKKKRSQTDNEKSESFKSNKQGAASASAIGSGSSTNIKINELIEKIKQQQSEFTTTNGKSISTNLIRVADGTSLTNSDRINTDLNSFTNEAVLNTADFELRLDNVNKKANANLLVASSLPSSKFKLPNGKKTSNSSGNSRKKVKTGNGELSSSSTASIEPSSSILLKEFTESSPAKLNGKRRRSSQKSASHDNVEESTLTSTVSNKNAVDRQPTTARRSKSGQRAATNVIEPTKPDINDENVSNCFESFKVDSMSNDELRSIVIQQGSQNGTGAIHVNTGIISISEASNGMITSASSKVSIQNIEEHSSCSTSSQQDEEIKELLAKKNNFLQQISSSSGGVNSTNSTVTSFANALDTAGLLGENVSAAVAAVMTTKTIKGNSLDPSGSNTPTILTNDSLGNECKSNIEKSSTTNSNGMKTSLKKILNLEIMLFFLNKKFIRYFFFFSFSNSNGKYWSILIV
jgi:hypothetical protein